MKIRLILQFLVLAAFLCLPVLSIAQIDDFDPGGDPDTPVPFDGGISLLVAAGVGYGVRKVYQKKKADNDATKAAL